MNQAGFVAFEKGWSAIREEDRGMLWEHLVLDALRFHCGDEDLFYWQDKSRRELDFVVRRGRNRVDAIECKINPDRLDQKPFAAFRALYPKGGNYIISPAATEPYRIRRGGLTFTVCTAGPLPE